MQSEKLGVKIDPTLGLQVLSVLYEIAYTVACMHAFGPFGYHICIQRITV